MLPDLVPVGRAPADLFAAPDEEARATLRMAALDGINRRFGREKLRYGGELIGTGWPRRAGRVSPISTTRWGALPRVRAC
nr:DUF4113 domain-containing protein [Thiocystis minor]